METLANEKSAQRDANTARALAVVRFGHRPPARPPARCNANTRTDRTDNNTLRPAKLSAQCNNQRVVFCFVAKRRRKRTRKKITECRTESANYAERGQTIDWANRIEEGQNL